MAIVSACLVTGIAAGLGASTALANQTSCAPPDVIPNPLPPTPWKTGGVPVGGCEPREQGQTASPGQPREPIDVPPNPMPPTPWKDGTAGEPAGAAQAADLPQAATAPGATSAADPVVGAAPEPRQAPRAAVNRVKPKRAKAKKQPVRKAKARKRASRRR
jgi:hypothetical protein